MMLIYIIIVFSLDRQRFLDDESFFGVSASEKEKDISPRNNFLQRNLIILYKY